MSQYKQKYKVALLGEPGVGKTTFALRMKYGRFIDTFSDTAPKDTGSVYYDTEVNNEEIKVQLQEPAGTERFRSITTSIYRDADAVIFMYSVTSPVSLQDLEYSFRAIVDDFQRDGDTTWALFGNKCDLPSEIYDLKEKVTMVSERLLGSTELSDHHFFMSAKTGQGIKEALEEVVREIYKRKNALTSIKRGGTIGQGLSVKISSAQPKKKSCCKD